MGPLLHFGDELECLDVNALEHVIAHLAWSDPQLRSFAVSVASLNARAPGVWSTESAEWQRFDVTNRAQLDLFAARSYGAGAHEPTPHLLVVDHVSPAADETDPPGVGQCAAMVLHGPRVFFHPAQQVTFVVGVGRTGNAVPCENALHLGHGRCLLPYLGAPRWSLDRVNSRVGEQFEADRIAESLLDAVPRERAPGNPGWMPDRGDFEYVSLIAAEGYSRWVNAGHEFIRYFGQRPIRVNRSRATLLRRYRTIGDWLRHAWTDCIDYADIACAFARPRKTLAVAQAAGVSSSTVAPRGQPRTPAPAVQAGSNTPAKSVSLLFNVSLQVALTNRFFAGQPAPPVRDQILLQRRFADGRLIRGLLALQDHRLCLDVVGR